ncbi:hypothetical protein ES705_35459 [subsurface metagenome]
MKTTKIEVREELGAYDGKIKFYREPDNTLVFETDTGTIKIKDGTITLSGSIKIDGLNIGTSANPNLLMLTPISVWLDAAIFITSVLAVGYANTAGVIYLYNAAGLATVTLIGSGGHAKFKGGLNVGSATGALPGQGRLSGDVSIGTDQNKSPLQVGETTLASALPDTVALFTSKHTGTANTRFTIMARTDGGECILQFGKPSDEDSGAIGYAQGTNIMTFRLSGGPRMTLGPTGDLSPTGFLSTHGNELLATKIIRHEIMGEEASAGVFTEPFTMAPLSKITSITTSLNADGLAFYNEAHAGMKAMYDGAEIFIYEGPTEWRTEEDVVTIVVTYEK